MLLDYIGFSQPAEDGRFKVEEVTFSPAEAAGFLDLPESILYSLVHVPGVCSRFESTGRISEGAIRHIYAKLNTQIAAASP